MEFRVLGDLKVQHDGRAIPLGAHQQRAVLAILVLQAGEVVTADRLIDALWGDEPPLRAAKTVQVYVSRLRKTLAAAADPAADDPIVTRDHGYVLVVDPAQIDAAAFEALLAEGRRALADGAFPLAAERLSAGLALWRGPALSDFTFDAWAADEVARLEELRLEALEARIDADLELGRQAALVAELDALIARHPLREHLRAQLMLALYRCGRQSDALAVFQDARRVLVDELGIEPGPALRDRHGAILRQDRALDAALPAEPPAVRRDRRRDRPRWPVVAGLGVVACGAVAITAIALTTGSGSSITVEANSVAVIDPAHNAVTRAITVGARPGDIAAGAGGVWVANLDDDSLSKIDPRAQRVERSVYPGTSVNGLTTTKDAVWTLDAANAALLRIDPTFGQVIKRTGLGRPPGGSNTVPSPVATGTGSVWAATGLSAVARIAARSGDLESTVDVGNEPAGIAQGAGATWVADDLDDTVSQIDRAGRLANTIPVGHGASAIAVGDGGVWVADTVDGNVTRLDPSSGATTASIRVGAEPTGIAVGPGAVWVANSADGTVSRIDPRSNRVVATIAVGGSPAHIVVAARRVWVTVQAGTAPSTAAPAGTLRIVQQRDFNSTDPALLGSYGPQASQLAYALCARLLDYPDRPAPQGTRLVPEIATAMPTVSAHGRTYRYTLRSGFRFSSGQPITGLAFKTAIERYLSPKLHDPAGVDFVFAGIVGYGAYEAGQAHHLAGVSATDTTLTVRLRRPDPALPARLAIPSLCPVPPNTPISAEGIDRIPSAGPYYIASHAPNRELVLRRNPFYHGSRPRLSAEIDYRFGGGPEANAAAVESGRADYATATIGDQHFASSVSAATQARLAQRYGPGSPAARAGRQRYFSNRTLTLQYLLLNSRRPLFATTRMRRAVNFAVDRKALAATAGQGFSGLPTDQYLPAGMPGYRDSDIYPLGRPNLARARRLAGHGRHRAVMYTCNRPACVRVAEIVKADLRPLGIDVVIKPFALLPMFRHEFTRGAAFDIGWYGWTLDFPDPSDFLGPPFSGSDVDFPGADGQRYKARLAAVSRLSGEARLRAYGQLDIEIAQHAAPVVAFADITADDFFSARTGCQVFQPIYGMDLGALCRRG